MYSTKVNDKKFEFTSTTDGWMVNSQQLHWDSVQLAPNYFHVLHKGKSFRAEIVKIDKETKTYVCKVNGRLYTVELKDKLDLLLERMGLQGSSAGKVNIIKAPMPGLIIDLKIAAGDHVKAGDPLLILEAMKMENILKSPGDGVVKTIKVKKGDSVEKGHVLIEF
jgi:biotin carboxyl carrier protein